MARQRRIDRLRRRLDRIRAGRSGGAKQSAAGDEDAAPDSPSAPDAGGWTPPGASVEPTQPDEERTTAESSATSGSAGEKEPEEIFTIGELRAPEPQGRLGGLRERLGARAGRLARSRGRGGEGIGSRFDRRRLQALRERTASRLDREQLRALRERTGERLAPVGTGLRQGARGTREGLVTGWEVVVDSWFRLSLEMRQRLAAAAAFGVLVLLFFLVFLPNAPCGFPGGDRCPPEDQAIGLVPADAGAYLHVNLDLDTDQFEVASELAARLPSLAADASGLLAPLTGFELDYETEVRPWGGGEVAVVVGGAGERMTMIEARDPEGALGFAGARLGPGVEESEVEGIIVRTDRDGTAAALLGGFLLLGDEGVVRSTIERDADPQASSLATEEAVTRARAELPEERIADLYLSAGLARLLAREGELGGFNTFVNAEATEGLAAAAVLDAEEGGGLSLSVRSLQDPDAEGDGVLAALPPFEPTLDERVSSDAYVYLGLGDPGASAAALVDQAASVSPPLRRSLRAFGRRIGREGGVELGSELPPLLSGEAALTIEPKAGAAVEELEPEPALPPLPGPAVDPPYLGLIADEVDAGVARETLARLQAPLAAAIDPAAGQAPAFRTLDIGGAEAQALRLSPSVEVTYALFDGLLVAGSDPAAVARVRDGGDPLADSERFRAALEHLSDEVSILLYLDLPSLLTLGEEVADLALIPEYTRLAPDLRQVEAAALGLTSASALLATDVRLQLAPEGEIALPAGAGESDPG